MDDCVAGVEGIPYCACKQAGVTCVSQDAGTSSALALTDAVRLVLRATFVTGGIVLFTGNLQRCHSVPELYKKKTDWEELRDGGMDEAYVVLQRGRDGI